MVAVYEYAPQSVYISQLLSNLLLCNVDKPDRFELAFKACNFTDKLEKCNTTALISRLKFAEESYNDAYFQFYDIQNALKATWAFLSTGFRIAMSAVALLANLITIAVILKTRSQFRKSGTIRKKDDPLNAITEPFFTYMLVNALFNSTYCLVYIFDYSIACVPVAFDDASVKNNCQTADKWVSTVTMVFKLMADFT
jgi:hypothetical protein